ncbi:MAG TPA: AraC family transcriptional regulator [Polyangiales bacterium]|nr:AraC family transcriptional regulator [Polyangiales bacterium]
MQDTTDALSEALRGVRITGTLFLNGELSAPWGVSTPRIEGLVIFHLVTEGRATVRVPGSEAVTLEAGSIVVFPTGDAHELWIGTNSTMVDASPLVPKILAGELRVERSGGGGAITRLICGYFGCEPATERLLLAGLPRMFTVNIRRDGSGAWLESALRHSADLVDSGLPGRRALLSKLTEALFVETLSRYMDDLPAERTGWLAAARDDVVGKALALLHRDPARAWSLESLAREAGASRTVLVERFGRLLGIAPLAYLARWRLQRAASLLETTEHTVLRIAMDVGYESEAAFSRAFKREMGEPPARYRRGKKLASRS